MEKEGWNNVKRVCSIWCLVLFYVVATQNGVEAGEITCHAIRYTFLQKNLDISDVPKTTQQGEQLNYGKNPPFQPAKVRNFPV